METRIPAARRSGATSKRISEAGTVLLLSSLGQLPTSNHVIGRQRSGNSGRSLESFQLVIKNHPLSAEYLFMGIGPKRTNVPGNERAVGSNSFEPKGTMERAKPETRPREKGVAGSGPGKDQDAAHREGSTALPSTSRAEASPTDNGGKVQPTPKARILIVDDDAAIVRLLAGKLKLEGYACHTASSVTEALEALSLQTFDAVISDLHMPGQSGLDLLKQVCAKYPHIAFLMATGDGDIQVGIQAMKAGAVDYVLKPFRLDAVLAGLERGLERRRLECEVENYRQNLEQIVDQRTRQLRSAIRRIELTYDETLEALGAALDLRDNDTAGHSKRVTFFTLKMARVMNCSKEELKQIERGAYLHDIGKIGIPDAILLKPGKLTAEEIEIMRQHVRIGYDLVCRISFLAMASQIVLTHQERFDGIGYPQGLAAEEIPLGARIFSVADTLDAMTSDRPYRSGLPYSTAREEIRKEGGSQFDPSVVEVFLTIPEEAWESIRRNAASKNDGRRRAVTVVAGN